MFAQSLRLGRAIVPIGPRDSHNILQSWRGCICPRQEYRTSRLFSSTGAQQEQSDKNARIASYLLAIVIGGVGATYASVPLYKMFCQATGFGGTTQRVTLTEWAETQEDKEAGRSTTGRKVSEVLMEKLYSLSNVPGVRQQAGHGANTWTDEDAAAKLASLKPVEGGRLIRVTFDSTIGDVLPWSFIPTQPYVRVVPGETSLAFFTTTNHSDKAITGVATYNVYPPKAGLYFNKIQCFCFEEQRLLPGETIDMPVFFFIDPEYETDPGLKRCNNITLVSIK
jgi:cytochrome c oxidase assembly protein subunit 11